MDKQWQKPRIFNFRANCCQNATSGDEELASKLAGHLAKILADNVPIALGLEIIFLQRAVFGRPRDEGGLQAELLDRTSTRLNSSHRR